MTIEIHRPELEALIMERMKEGTFQNVEDVLMQALQSSPLPAGDLGGHSHGASAATGAELIAVMQDSPYKEISLEPERQALPVHDPSF
jgi:hypothetical protein